MEQMEGGSHGWRMLCGHEKEQEKVGENRKGQPLKEKVR